MVGSRRIAARAMRGAISLSSSRYFPLVRYSILVKPVVLHGAARLEQRPHARAARGQDDVRGERDQFRRVAAKALGIAGGPARVDSHVAPVGPARLLQCLDKCYEAGLPCGIVCGQSHENTDPPHPVALL